MRHLPIFVSLLALGACGPLPMPEDDAGLINDTDAGLIITDAGLINTDAGLIIDAGIPDAGPLGLPVYPQATKHSPLTPDIVAHLQAIAALNTTRDANRFSKVGDSNTVSTGYVSCFSGANVDLSGRDSLDAGLVHFRADTSFSRTSLTATVGWSAQSAVAGSPSPLQQEIDAYNPRYATVMFGTNDVGFANPDLYGRSLFTIIDTLSMQGVVPIITSIPPRDDSATADAWVPRYNLVARGIAQARRVPFVDLHRELLTTPTHGLGGDGVHLNTYVTTGARGCFFTAAGLGFGHNVRNLATLEALDRTWRAVEQSTAPDQSAPRRTQSGKRGDEIPITTLPFVDTRDTRNDGESNTASYPACSMANESGNEVLYRLELTQNVNLRAFVISLGTGDVDIHLLDSTNTCVARNDKVITRAMTPGTYFLSLDTFATSSGTLPGEYLLVVMAE